MAWIQVASAAVQFGVQQLQQQRSDREALRTAREQQALNNQEIRRQIVELGALEARPASEQRLALGAAGVRGGSVVEGVNAELMAFNRRLEQERLARGIDTSLQDARTAKGPLGEVVQSYFEAVYGKPAKQVGQAVEKTGKSVEKEFKRAGKKIKKALGL